jgi:hypothetical protein
MTQPRDIDGIAVFGEHEPGTLDQMRAVARSTARAALMADAHHGYVMPVGGVAAYRDQVSVMGVGVDIACIAAGQPVTLGDGRARAIEQVGAGDGAVCWDGARVRAIAPCLGAVPRGARSVLALTLANGRTVRATPDHLVLAQEGWTPAGALRPGDRIACTVRRGLPTSRRPRRRSRSRCRRPSRATRSPSAGGSRSGRGTHAFRRSCGCWATSVATGTCRATASS